MIIDIREPSVDPVRLYYDFMLWMKDEFGHGADSAWKYSWQINSWDLKARVALWAGLDYQKDLLILDSLLCCWVSLGFLEAYGFAGAKSAYVYVFKERAG
jgi:hypothetical protein